MKIKVYILLIFIQVFPLFSFAQNTVEFRQLRGDNVSTQSITYAVANDSNGNVWIASEEGVLKHNSKFFTIYNSYNGLPDLVSNRTKEVFVDSKQRVWIGSEKGVCLYNDNLDIFEYVKSEGAFDPSLVVVIIEDNDHTIWAGGFNGLWKYDEISQQMVKLIANRNIQALHPFNDHLIFGTQKGAFYYDIKKKLLEAIPLDSEEKNIWNISSIDDEILIASKTGELYKTQNDLRPTTRVNFNFELTDAITDVIKTSKNTYLLATDGDGIYKLNSQYQKIDHYIEDPNEPYSISSNGVYDIALDSEGVLWVATYGGGLNYLNSSELPFQNIRHKINDENSIATNFTRAIEKDKNGNIWFGTKKGISILNGENKSWKHIKNLSNSNGDTDVIVLALQPDDNYMWIGTYNEGLFKINISTLEKTHYNSEVSKDILEKVYAIHKDSKNNIWIGGIEKDLTVIAADNAITTYPIQQIKSILETKSGEILISGRQGVFKINHQLKTSELIEDLIPNKKSLAFTTINAVYETNDGGLILATNGEGLVFYDANKAEIKKLKISSGLPSDIVQGIIPINDTNLWASTTKGLVHIKIEEKDTIINIYDEKDGLASTEFNYGSFKKLDDSVLAFGGIDGVTLFNPETIKNESYTPKLVFDTFKVSNKLINPGSEILEKHINKTGKIVLNHTENAIEIQFTGILHSSPSKIKYSWILDGFDKAWSTPSNINFATYTNLNPGAYTFKVKASNKYGKFSKERELKIKISSPWWATKGAYLLYGLALLALLYTIIHFTSVVIKKKNADEQIDFFNNITHEIKTPLTILISSLDSVTDNINSKDASTAQIKTTVKRINSLFEQMLNFQKVTSTDNLDLDISDLDVYAHIEKRITDFEPLTKDNHIEILLNNNWNENFYFDKDTFDKMVLNLISNAIKYSLENGKILINTSKTQTGDLKIEFIDEGIGIPKDQQRFILKRYYRARNVINSQRPGTGLGLMMVKKLLEKTGGSISFESEENKGSTFTLILKNKKDQFNKKIKGRERITNNFKDVYEEHLEIAEFSDSKILIVEDNDDLRQLLANTLGTYFQIFEAKNGKEGLEMTSQIFPDLVLTDLIMPEMDGMQMAKALKSNIILNHIPVFMLTVLQNSSQKLESIESGISEYIEKPVDIKLLLAKIINTLKFQKKLRDKYIHDADADNAELFRNENDRTFLQDLEGTIIENIENNSFSVHDLSASFGMSRTSLYMKLKNLVDLSPQDFIIHTKLKHAKKLLIKGDLSIKEVAYQSGFSNPKYFSTSFKKFYKITPSGFIESLKK